MQNLFRNEPPSLSFWFLSLAASGFISGFVGPIIFLPDSNTGPIIGLFITGPGGLALGVILGLLCALLSPATETRWKVLIAANVAVASGTLIFCILVPQPNLVGEVIDAQIQSCKSPDKIMAAAIEDWEKRIEKVTWAAPRNGWKEDTQSMLREDPGVVLEVKILRKNAIYEKQKIWNKGVRYAEGWRSEYETKSYFARYAGGSCDGYPIGAQAQYFPPHATSKEWPSKELPIFLDMLVLESIPAQYQSLIK